MKAWMFLPTGFAVAVAHAQSASCAFFWEANDGGSWHRGQISTTSQIVHVRLVAEWGPIDGRGFGATNFDVAVTGARQLDDAMNFMRPSPFDFAGQTVAAFRQGTTIKLDDSRDADPVGVGSFWISCTQTNGDFGETVNHDNPVTLFAFDLALADEAGTRSVDSVHRLLAPTVNTRIYDRFGGRLDAFGLTHPVDVIYVPAPAVATLFACCGAIASRRR